MTRDDNYSPFRKTDFRPPELVILETCWRVIGPSQVVIACGVFKHPAGVEVRCAYADQPDNLLRSEVASDIEIGRDVAAAWKQAVIERGFSEVPEACS